MGTQDTLLIRSEVHRHAGLDGHQVVHMPPVHGVRQEAPVFDDQAPSVHHGTCTGAA